MKRFLVLYATREGHTARIAAYLAQVLHTLGFETDVLDAAKISKAFRLDDYCGAILAASVHRCRHEREMVSFVKKHLNQLNSMHAGFLSVSLSEAGAEDEKAPPERRVQAAKDAQMMLGAFLTKTGWLPTRTKAVAGALVYSRYNFLLRHIMKRIAAKAGGDTDTTKDYVYTNWRALDRFAADFALACAASR